MTIQIIGGVDTHAAVHCAVAIDTAGRLLGVGEFPTTEAGTADSTAGWDPTAR